MKKESIPKYTLGSTVFVPMTISETKMSQLGAITYTLTAKRSPGSIEKEVSLSLSDYDMDAIGVGGEHYEVGDVLMTRCPHIGPNSYIPIGTLVRITCVNPNGCSYDIETLDKEIRCIGCGPMI